MSITAFCARACSTGGGHIPAVNRALNNVLPACIASAYNLGVLCLKEVELGPDEACSLAASLRTLDHLTQLQLSSAFRSQADARPRLAADNGLMHAVASLSTLRNVALEVLAPRVIYPVPLLQALTSLTLQFSQDFSPSARKRPAGMLCAHLTSL